MTKEGKRSLLKASLVISLPITIWGGYSCLVSLLSARDARDVSQQIVSARQAIEKLPPGIDRPEEFVRRLRSIDPGHARWEVKVALSHYVAAMEQATEALKNHQDELPLEKVCAERAQELTDAINRSQ
jgi:hypothetical protein